MTKAEIQAHAEAQANMTGDSYSECVAWIRDALADGATYSETEGWTWPVTDAAGSRPGL